MLAFLFLSLTAFAQEYNSTIMGGSLVAPGETAGKVTVALLSGSGGVLCSGVIISESAVLTAGHCNSARKVAFTTQVSSKAPIRNVARLTTAPGFFVGNPPNLNPDQVLPAIRNDLAVIRFEGGLPAGYEVAKLPGSGSQPKNGKGITIVGYGKNDTGSVDGKLRKLGGAVNLGEQFSHNMIDEFKKFAVLTTIKKAPCHGDSGGPVLASTTVVGITSHRMGEAPNNACECQALVFTNVGDYVPWIKAQM